VRAFAGVVVAGVAGTVFTVASVLAGPSQALTATHAGRDNTSTDHCGDGGTAHEQTITSIEPAAARCVCRLR
jgi:hypothetical protein